MQDFENMQLTVKKVLPDRSNVKGQKFMKNSNETFGVIFK